MRIQSLLAAVCLFALATPTAASAQGIALGVDGAFVLPQGDLANAAGNQIGALVRAEVSLLKMISLTARLGYLYGMETDSGLSQSALDVIPILAGVKWCPVLPTPLYVAGELGLMSATYRIGGNQKDESWTGGTLGAGLKFAGIDVRAQMIFYDVNHMDETYGVMISIGYDFVSLGL